MESVFATTVIRARCVIKVRYTFVYVERNILYNNPMHAGNGVGNRDCFDAVHTTMGRVENSDKA